MTQDQTTINFIRKVMDLKTKIINSQFKEPIIEAIEEVIIKSKNITPRTITLGNGNKFTDFEGKEMEIKILESSIRHIKDGTYPDLKTIHFQVSGTIISLLITLFHLSIDQIDEISNLNQ